MAGRIGEERFRSIMHLFDKFDVSVCFQLDLEGKGAFDTNSELRMVYINPKKANAITLIHELGHVLTHPMCCKEHGEYAVYGVVVALAAMLEIEVSEYEYLYALGFSTVEACSAMELRSRKDRIIPLIPPQRNMRET